MKTLQCHDANIIRRLRYYSPKRWGNVLLPLHPLFRFKTPIINSQLGKMTHPLTNGLFFQGNCSTHVDGT